MPTAAERITDFLVLPAQSRRRTLVCSSSPLERSVVARSSTWRTWFQGQGAIKGQRVAVPPGRSKPALEALDDPLVLNVTSQDPRNDRRIARSNLLAAAANLQSDDDLIRCWTWVMIWGSGVLNGRGPMNTTKGLADPNLVHRLRSSADLVAANAVQRAYEEISPLRGSGPPFFTKWLWVCGLAPSATSRPLILDGRVESTLRKLGVSPVAGDAAYYANHLLPMLAAWAAEVRRLIGGAADAEKIEWLLFDREPGHLHGWL